MTGSGVQYTPIFLAKSTTFDRIAVRSISTGSIVSTVGVRLGVFADSDGIPGARQFDAGSITMVPGSGTATHAITLNPPQTFGPGWFWLAASATTNTGYTMRGYTAYNDNCWWQFRMMGDPSFDSFSFNYFTPTNYSGTGFPDPAESAGGGTSGYAAMAVYLRRA